MSKPHTFSVIWEDAIRENVFVEPALNQWNPVMRYPNRVKKENAVIYQAPVGHLKESLVVGSTHMLEHTNAHDPVKCFVQVAIVLKSNFNGKPFTTLTGNFRLLHGNGAANHTNSIVFSEILAQTFKK